MAQEESGAAQSELSTNALLEMNDMKSKVSRLTEQNTKLEGDVSYLSSLSEQVDLLWKCRPPGQTGDEDQERAVTAVEVQDEMDEFRNDVYRKLKELAAGLNNLRESVRLIEKDKEESWEALSHKLSNLVEDSVGSLTERLTELEHTVQSHGTTPVTEEDVLNMETWSTLEQVIWSELSKVKEQAQEVPNMYTLCGELHENQKSQEKQQTRSRCSKRKEGESSESLGYVPGAPASSSTASAPLRLCYHADTYATHHSGTTNSH